MKKMCLVVMCLVFLQCASQATVRFGVGSQWLGDTDMAIGFDIGAGSKEFGFDFAHCGLQPTLYSFGTVELNQNRLGIYYVPFDFLMLQTGLHNTKLNLSDSKQEVLGTKNSVNWSGLYAIISFPIRVEQTYFIKPFFGVFSVDDGKRTESAFGIALGADFEPDQQKVLF